MRRMILSALVLLTAGCDRELTRSNAAGLIRGHLTALAPTLIRSDSLRLEINVEEILRPAEGTREVRFRALYSAPDTAGVMRSDSSQQLTAEFHRSDRGWAMRRYGADFKTFVAGIVSM